jgi:hypothetical protein
MKSQSRVYFTIIFCTSRYPRSSLLIGIGTAVQAALTLWCTLSIDGAVFRFQPASEGMNMTCQVELLELTYQRAGTGLVGGEL